MVLQYGQEIKEGIMAREKKVMLSIRIEPELIQSLDDVARLRKTTRSKLLRTLAQNAAAFYDFLIAEKAKQKAGAVKLDEDLTRWVLEQSPSGVNSKMMRFLSQILGQAAEIREVQEEESSGDKT
jgi:predicted transcriptional regulator